MRVEEILEQMESVLANGALIPMRKNSVIINANEGSVQTTDLRVDAGKDLYVTVVSAEEATVAYEKPAE